MAAKKHGLGRGLDALIQRSIPEQKPEEEKFESSADAELSNSSNGADAPAAAFGKTACADFASAGYKNDAAEEALSQSANRVSADRGSENPVLQNRTAGTGRTAAEKNKGQEPTNENGVMMVRLSKIEPDRSQPRRKFDEETLQELSDSIKKYGVLEPLLVQNKGDHYEIVAGERRWRAAKLAGVKEVPVVVGSYDERTKTEIQLIENVQREDINPIEEARAYKRLIEEYSLKQDEVAEAVSKNRTTITNALRLLKLDERVQEMLTDPAGGLSAGHARALIMIEDPETQYAAAKKVAEEKLSVRETEKLVKNLGKTHAQKKKDPAMEAIYRDIESRLKTSLGTKATIVSKNGKGGKLEIEFYDSDSLDKIIEKLL